MNGIFIMSGPLCRKHDSLSPRIIDITPTVLYLMGVPLLEGWTAVLEEIIDPVYIESHPIKEAGTVELAKMVFITLKRMKIRL